MIDDPTHRWPFDEGVGTVAADDVGDRHATLAAGASWVPGKRGTALHFDKTAEGHASFTELDLGATHTVAFWFTVRDVAPNADGVVVGGPSGSYALYFDDTSLYYSAGTGNFVNVGHGGLALLRGPNHFAVARDLGTVQFYFNGAPLGPPKALNFPTNTVRISTFGSYDSFTFPSMTDLDEVHVYDRKLTDADVAELFAFTGGAGSTIVTVDPAIEGAGDPAVVTRKRRPLTAAVDGEAARALTAAKCRALATAEDVQQPRVIPAQHRRQLAPALELGAARSLGRIARRRVDHAYESDIAALVAVLGPAAHFARITTSDRPAVAATATSRAAVLSEIGDRRS